MSYRIPDYELVASVLAGNNEAFNALFDRYLAMVRGEADRLGLHASQGDVIQETFLRAYLRLDELTDPSRFPAWLRRIAQRICLAEVRKQHPQEAMVDDLVSAESVANVTRVEVRDVLDSLTPDDRDALTLHYLLGVDTAAAAKAMGMQPQSYRVRLHRARLRARTILTSQRIQEIMIMSGISGAELANRLVQEAQKAIYAGPVLVHDWVLYRRKLEEALQADPENVDAAWQLGRKLAKEGEYKPALKLLQGLWEWGIQDAWTPLTIAWCLDYQGKRAEALQWYARTALLPFLSETQRKAATAGIEAPQSPKSFPVIPDGLTEIAHDGWTATASNDRCPPVHAIDGNTNSRWSPMGEGQTPGAWLRIDLGSEVPALAGVWLDDDAAGQSNVQNDAPRRCVVSLSRDGEWWKRVGDWRWTPNHYMEAWWQPVSARYLLLEQMEYGSPEWWSVYETHVYRSTI